jgi:glycosyltransferase involved in cell wall biosynthesis
MVDDKSPIPVLVVVPSLGRGGTETHLLRVLPELVKAGQNVELFSLRDGELRTLFAEAGVPVNAPARYWVLNYFAYIWKMLVTRPVAVHFFLPMAYVLCAPIAWILRVPGIMSRRSLNVYQRSHPVASKIERGLHKRMSRILGNSQKVVDQLAQDENVPVRKLGLIYNGISISDLPSNMQKKEYRRTLGLSDDAIVMTIVANLIPYKGHADLVDACGLLMELSSDAWQVLVVGHDSAGIQEELQRRAQRLGVMERLSFLGRRTDAQEILYASDIGILCSHEEGFSNAVLEGMAAGLPMIVTDVGGNAEAVQHSVTGLVVPAKSPKCLAAAMMTLTEDAKLRSEMGKRARERCMREFSMSACVEAYQREYKNISR